MESDHGVSPLQFIQVDKYEAFRAEFAALDGDLVIHFFPPKAPRPRYWESLFPAVLDPVARNLFKAEYPRLKATRITEFDIDSWWFRAYGFGNVLDPKALAYRFFDTLSRALEIKKEM